MNDESGTDVDDDASPGQLVDRVHEELLATEELPVDREASRWIGEAQAVAADAASGALADEVIRERVAHVRELLENVDETGHAAVDAHVERARDFAAAVAPAAE